MNITNVLQNAWRDVAHLSVQGYSLNESMVALQLGKSISAADQGLHYSIDCRKTEGEQDVSTLVITDGQASGRVIFVGKLLPALASRKLQIKELEKLVAVLDRGETSVLGMDDSSGEYVQSPAPLAESALFGILLLPDQPQWDVRHAELAAELEPGQLSRFVYAYSIDGETGPGFHFQSGLDHVHVMEEQKYPEFVLRLDSGRKVRVDTLVWSPSYDETIRLAEHGPGKHRVIKRNVRRATEFFHHRKVFLFEPTLVGCDPQRVENTCVIAWLSSEPMDEGALYSELVVMFFTEFQPGVTFEQLVTEGIAGLDWEALAVDVDDKSPAIWEPGWKDRTLH
jgi:hypothetical protein